MQLNTDAPMSPPRDAATVVLLRDGAEGLEVFLVKRHGLSDVLGGAYVFPGGKLDDADTQLAAHLDQTEPALHAALGETATPSPIAMGLYVAALREAFEECGVLFTLQAAAARAAVAHAPDMPFNTLVNGLNLQLQTLQLQPWTRWITPRMPSVGSKRFDTRFFVAQAPADQVAQHDDVETTASAWLAPKAALQQYWERHIELAPPQIMSLAHLARHATVQSVLQEAKQRPPPLILPETFEEDGQRLICYPGDARHSVRAIAMPGPTRVVYRNQRFEPQAGFAGLFA